MSTAFSATDAAQAISVETRFGRPVPWARVAMATDSGDAHELNDDRCLVLTSRDLGDRAPAPWRDFMLCLLADGATGSTFRPEAAKAYGGESRGQAGWRASQLAQAAFVEQFLSSDEVDVLERLKEGLRAADRALVDSNEGSLSTTLVALFVAADGTACAASIGDSVLLVLPPGRRTADERRIKKLGYEDSSAVGSGDTTLQSIDESELIEQWWPGKEDVRATGSARLVPGTYLVLLSDGISDNLPVETIDRLLHRHALDAATLSLAAQTRERRAEAQKRGGGSTQQLGLDNMTALVVRFAGGGSGSAIPPGDREDTTLLTVQGTHGGPQPDSAHQFGLICAESAGAEDAPTFLRRVLASEHTGSLEKRMSVAIAAGATGRDLHGFAAVAADDSGDHHAVSSGGARIPTGSTIGSRRVAAARETPLQRFIYTPAIWGSCLASLAVFLLVSTAFATGTIRPAPPAPAAPRPGDPTPTPDTRPALSIGGFVLQAPAVQAPVPVSTVTATADDPARSTEMDPVPLPAESEPADAVPAPQSVPPCSSLLRLGCASPPPPPVIRRAPPAQAPPPPVVPFAVPSPAATNDQEIADVRSDEAGPPRGSTLEAALQNASLADDNFTRQVDPRSRDGR